VLVKGKTDRIRDLPKDKGKRITDKRGKDVSVARDREKEKRRERERRNTVFVIVGRTKGVIVLKRTTLVVNRRKTVLVLVARDRTTGQGSGRGGRASG
jgi:hypothetical protein